MDTDVRQQIDWLQRWDAQQEAYVPEREARFTAMFDALAVLMRPGIDQPAAACPLPPRRAIAVRSLGEIGGRRRDRVENDPNGHNHRRCSLLTSHLTSVDRAGRIPAEDRPAAGARLAGGASVTGCGGPAGADDRGRGVFVNPVCFGDLHVDEPGVAQGMLELPPGESTGDAPGPLLHVRAGGVVHVGAGDDVGDGEPTARAQHPGGLAQHRGLVSGQVDDAVEMTTSTLASGRGMCSR